METLTSNAAEISAVEKSIYENRVMLEQVQMENSRLHMVKTCPNQHRRISTSLEMFFQQCFLTTLYLQCIEQMKEEILDAEKDKEKYMQEAKWMTEGKQSLFSESFDKHLAILK